MTDLRIASSEADARAAEAVEEHHAQLAGALAVQAEALAGLARDGRGEGLAGLRDDLVAWGRGELLPHARAEEGTLYRVAAERHPDARLLVEAMLAEHEVIGGLLDDLAAASEPVAAAVAAGSLRAVFEIHLAKENDQVLPLLVADGGVSVADLLAGMHELLGGGSGHGHEDGHGEGRVAVPAAAHADGHSCGCGEVDPPTWPELDARAVPHAIRHATIFGALEAVRPGSGLVLVAPHDPLPLLAQIETREPGSFEVSYLERGPEVWRLSLARLAG